VEPDQESQADLTRGPQQRLKRVRHLRGLLIDAQAHRPGRNDPPPSEHANVPSPVKDGGRGYRLLKGELTVSFAEFLEAVEAVARIAHHLAGLAHTIDLFASSGTLTLESSVFSQTPRPGAARPDRPAPGPRLMRQQR
jgi:hypothetical protein